MSPAAGAIRLVLLAGLLAGSVVAAPVSVVAAEAPTGPLDPSSMAAPGLGAQPTRTSALIAPLPRLRGGPAVVDGAEPACRAALARLGVTWVAAPPISSGRCGIAAPHAISAAAHGAISFSQPATLSCTAAATLASWLLEHVQPAARTHLQR
ncbi:MAG: extensin family protein, partial [Alphaproteobacteria bacterium]